MASQTLGITRFLCSAMVVLVGIGVALALTLLGPKMAPLKRGTPEDFWQVASDVRLRRGIDVYGDAYVVDDQWTAYTVPHLHGTDVFYVSLAEVSKRYDAVIQALNAASESGADTPFVTGFRKWKSEVRDNGGPQELVDCIREAGRAQLATEDPSLLELKIYNDQYFWLRWRRSGCYWANFVFEWTYLTGLALFAIWPGIRTGSPIQWAVHTGLLPVFFLLPTYLGYATYSFTSAGPSGGIVYPYLLMFARHGYVTNLDQQVLERLPQVLEPISTPLGGWMALTGMGMCGPTCALVLGLFLGALAFGFASIGRYWTARLRRA